MKEAPQARELDVGPLLDQGRSPLPAILEAVASLQPGQSLRIIAPFDPAPLRDLLGARGFAHKTTQSSGGAWVVEFTPCNEGP